MAGRQQATHAPLIQEDAQGSCASNALIGHDAARGAGTQALRSVGAGSKETTDPQPRMRAVQHTHEYDQSTTFAAHR